MMALPMPSFDPVLMMFRGVLCMKDCLFCKIVAGIIPAKKVFENDDCIAIHDIHPQAKTHLLVIPKKHYASLNELAAEEESGETLAGRMLLTGIRVAQQEKLVGFRSVINTGPSAGQTIFHLHVHILGGENLKGGFGA